MLRIIFVTMATADHAFVQLFMCNRCVCDCGGGSLGLSINEWLALIMTSERDNRRKHKRLVVHNKEMSMTIALHTSVVTVVKAFIPPLFMFAPYAHETMRIVEKLSDHC